MQMALPEFVRTARGMLGRVIIEHEDKQFRLIRFAVRQIFTSLTVGALRCF